MSFVVGFGSVVLLEGKSPIEKMPQLTLMVCLGKKKLNSTSLLQRRPFKFIKHGDDTALSPKFSSNGACSFPLNSFNSCCVLFSVRIHDTDTVI